MKLLLLDCNKVSTECFAQIASLCPDFDIKAERLSLSVFGDKADLLSYNDVNDFLNKQLFDAIVVADIFWPTGQNICQWCIRNEKKCYFWQHGQWIYTLNKENPQFAPYGVFFLGDNILKKCSSWPLAKKSKFIISGSPRYDNIDVNTNKEDYVYFSPPVVLEEVNGATSKYNAQVHKLLKSIKGIDNKVNLYLHPHYREGMVTELRSLFPNAKYIDKKEEVFKHISKAAKVLTHRNSTVILDAIACHVSVVLLNFDSLKNSFYPKEYFSEFAVESTTSENCVANLLSKSHEILDYEIKAKKHILLGDATSRILNVIKNEN